MAKDSTLRPLTSDEQKKKAELISAYSDFWNNIRFRKGWQKPVFQREEVLPLLDRAAEIVVRKRTELDRRSNGAFTMRMVDGSAREYFWTVTEHPIDPSDHTRAKERNFVHQIVHETFKDNNGYVEGLTANEIDEFIREIESQLDANLPVLDQCNRLLATISTVFHELNGKSDEFVKHLMEDEELARKIEALHEQLVKCESLSTSLCRQARDLQPGIEKQIAEDTAFQSDEDIENESEAAQQNEKPANLQETSRSLRESGNAVPVEEVKRVGTPSESDSDLIVEDLDHTAPNASEYANSPTVLPSQTDEMHSSEEEEIFSEEEAAPGEDEEQARIKEEEEKKRQEEEEKRRREEERRIQREEAIQRQRLLERAEQRRKLEEQESKQKAEVDNRAKKWAKVKFEPRFDIAERADGFVLTSYIPGMNRDDINLKYDTKKLTLTVSGVRVPTAAEEHQLAAQLRKSLAYRYGPRYQQKFSDEELEECLLRLGSDRFGSFTESYRLPEYADFDSISCTYEGGVLRIVVPAVRGVSHRVPNTRRPAYTPRQDIYSPFFQSPRGFW